MERIIRKFLAKVGHSLVTMHYFMDLVDQSQVVNFGCHSSELREYGTHVTIRETIVLQMPWLCAHLLDLVCHQNVLRETECERLRCDCHEVWKSMARLVCSPTWWTWSPL